MKMIRVTMLPLFLSVLRLVPLSSSTHSQAAGVIGTSTVSHGVQLSMTMQRYPYAWSALAQVEVKLRNLSRTTQHLQKVCGYGFAWVEVFNAAGTRVFPPVLLLQPVPHCAATKSLTLQPGQVYHRTLYVVLRAPHLRAVAAVGQNVTHSTIETGEVTLHLVPGRPLSVSPLRDQYPTAFVVKRPPGASGPLRAVAELNCSGKMSNVSTYSTSSLTTWTEPWHDIVAPPSGGTCDEQFMYAVAGFVNFPVVTLR